MRRTDVVHLGLMLLALGAAYVVPFELLVLSYVVLGPAHYATEISWLHDRDYFLPRKVLVIGLILAAVGAALIDDAATFGLVIWGTLAASLLLTGAASMIQRLILAAALAAFTGFLVLRDPFLGVVGILIPTLVHVSLFTLLFMTLGAMRARSAVQAGLVGLYLAAIALIVLVPPTAESVIPEFGQIAHDYFGGVAPALQHVFGTSGIVFDPRLTGLLGFVYSYHYLNWFIKADVIRWNAIPRARLIFLAAISAASTVLYFYDYALGFTVLIVFSLLHVVLEFPLNALAARQLGGAVTGALRRRFATTPV